MNTCLYGCPGARASLRLMFGIPPQPLYLSEWHLWLIISFFFQGCSDSKRNSSFVNCSDNEFRCLNKFYCIHKTWLCDGDTDCPDGSDESVQVCGIAQECRSDQFTCDNGECIPGHLQCSGKTECSDGSDEKLCRKCTFSEKLDSYFWVDLVIPQTFYSTTCSHSYIEMDWMAVGNFYFCNW